MYSAGIGWVKGSEHAQCWWCLMVIKALHRQGALLPCRPSKFAITGFTYAISWSQSNLGPFVKHFMEQTSVHPESRLILVTGREKFLFSCGVYTRKEIFVLCSFSLRGSVMSTITTTISTKALFYTLLHISEKWLAGAPKTYSIRH